MLHCALHMFWLSSAGRAGLKSRMSACLPKKWPAMQKLAYSPQACSCPVSPGCRSYCTERQGTGSAAKQPSMAQLANLSAAAGVHSLTCPLQVLWPATLLRLFQWYMLLKIGSGV